jgi:transposase-like protein
MVHFETRADNPRVPESPASGLVCPRCQKPRAVIANNPYATVMMFRCSACWFEWSSANLAKLLKLPVRTPRPSEA